jgi:uncharacterized protein (DUF1501 family)
MFGEYNRRHFMKHVAGMSAMAIPTMSFMRAIAKEAPVLKKNGKSLIVLWMSGGPSTIDLWDLKPGQPTGGQFKPISTAASGVQISEHLPTVAKQMKNLAIIRSLVTTEGDHNRGTQLVATGRAPSPVVQYPVLGSVAAKILAQKDLDLPSFISVGGGGGARVGSGFLGMTYAPFTVQNPGQLPENIAAPAGIDQARLQRRQEFFKDVEGSLKTNVAGGDATKAHDDIYKKAFSLAVSERRNVFQFNAQDTAAVTRYGNNAFGRGCLLAKKLTEAGAVAVEVDLGGWDNHQNIFNALHTTTGTGRADMLDKGMGSLVEDLAKSGKLKDTVILWAGEFGRTPRINANGGRDHYPRVWSVVVGGGAIKGGQVYGSSDSTGEAVKDNKVEIGDVFATVYKAMGIDPTPEVNASIRDNIGRPFAIAGDKSKPISALV